MKKGLFSAIACIIIGAPLHAQSLEEVYATYQVEIVTGVAILTVFLALLALMTALYALKVMTASKKPAEAQVESIPFWRRFWNKMNDSVPVARENEVMTSHEYDGIRELDNRLPPWWLYGFYFTIFFGVAYLINYHVLDTGMTQEEEYIAEMAKAEEEVSAYLASMDMLIDETSVSFTDSPEDLLVGQEVFEGKCAACHGINGEGGVGPNLADSYWIHGGDMSDIFKTIKYGVPTKGMIAWESQLTPKEMQQVSSYIYTMEGTNPPNAKEPQGELFERSDEPAEEEKSES